MPEHWTYTSIDASTEAESRADIIGRLNCYGQEGWEVFAITKSTGANDTIFWLKRRQPTNEDKPFREREACG